MDENGSELLPTRANYDDQVFGGHSSAGAQPVINRYFALVSLFAEVSIGVLPAYRTRRAQWPLLSLSEPAAC